jgi:hypothetical protein
VTEYNPYKAAGQKSYTPPGSAGVVSANVFMDRDMGAMNNQYDSEGNARGLLYQWGRKDPIPRTVDWRIPTTSSTYASDKKQYGTSTLFGGLYNTPDIHYSSATMFRIITNIKTPQWVFLFVPSPLTNPYFTQADHEASRDLWRRAADSLKGVFDPCPEGWRVPSYHEVGNTGTYPANPDNSPWSGLNDISFPYNVNNKGRTNDSLGYYPLCFYINRYNKGAYSESYPDSALYWACADTEPTYINLMRINAALLFGDKSNSIVVSGSGSGTPAPGRFFQDDVGNVRCVVDYDYLVKTGGGLFGTEGPKLRQKLKAANAFQ